MITLDDKYRFEDFGFICEPGNEDPLTPVFDRKTYTIPGRPGVIPFGTEIKEKQFSFPLRIIERFYTEMQRKFRAFAAFFFDQYGQPRKVKMVLDYDSDKYYFVELAQQLLPERLPEDGTLVLSLVAYDSYAFSTADAYDPIEKQIYDTGLKYDSGLIYPNTPAFQWIYEVHYSGIENHSHLEVPLKIVVKGRCKNPKITNLATGKWVQINETFTDADQLIIDAKAWTVVKNRTVNLLTKYKGDFIRLTGGNNGLMFESETEPNAQVSFEWSHLFL
ncbi:phage tail family protein [Bacillus pseudomycoides]|uniref:Phage tail family protein n=1 Tax=Bacillus bingmayongensis TaxID=1150157 RepID=A0ABU5JSI1_9BACI|nr:phage tail family protein [Bacillus pseudomycoides]